MKRLLTLLGAGLFLTGCETTVLTPDGRDGYYGHRDHRGDHLGSYDASDGYYENNNDNGGYRGHRRSTHISETNITENNITENNITRVDRPPGRARNPQQASRAHNNNPPPHPQAQNRPRKKHPQNGNNNGN